MKKSILSILIVLAIACIYCCVPDTPAEPEKNLTVSIKESEITLPFETEVSIDYTYADAEGALVFDSKNIPDGISVTNKVTSISEGYITFFSTLDSDSEYKVSLIFGDKNKSITKDIKLKTLKKETPFSIAVENNVVTLAYNEELQLKYTAINPEGEISVYFKNPIEGISLSNAFNKETSQGILTFKTTLKEEKELSGTIVFSDGKTSLEKEMKFKTSEWAEENPFSISIEASEISLNYDEEYKLEYTAVNPKGEVSVQFKNNIEGITLNNAFNKETNRGVITFKTNLKEEKELHGIIVFSDGKTSQEKEIIFKTREWSAKPYAISIKLTSDIIYPYPSNVTTEIPFTVECETQVNEVTVETGDGLKATVSTASDNKSGTISILAEENLGAEANVTITASNESGSVTESIRLKKAYLELSGYECSVPYTGTKQPYNFIVSTNLEFNVHIDEQAKDYINYTVQNNSINFNVTENPKWEPRTATITVSDSKNILSKDFVITQAMTQGSNASDREALMAIYESLNMKEWNDYGAFGTYYKNWGTDTPMDKWLGVALTGYNGEGRVWQLDLLGVQPKSTGVIPEEIGHLTKLRELLIYPNHYITKLPNSIKNLVNLKEICFLGDELDMDLKDWTGLTELMNNPECKLQLFSLGDTKLHGTYPEWTKRFDKDGQFDIEGCHFSGQVPDAVTKCEFWKKKYAYDADKLEACPRFDKTKYEKSEDGWYYFVPQGEATMFLQADNYALWEGERPSNTKWVDDKFGGHWEWTD